METIKLSFAERQSIITGTPRDIKRREQEILKLKKEIERLEHIIEVDKGLVHQCQQLNSVIDKPYEITVIPKEDYEEETLKK